MDASGTSTLIGKTFRLEGFAFAPHPERRPRVKIQITVFSVMPDETEHIICLSEIGKSQKKAHAAKLAENLGKTVGDDWVAPYAARSIKDASIDVGRPIIEDGWRGIDFRWFVSPQQQADNFNAENEVGASVLYWTGKRDGPGVESATRTPAEVLGGHTAVVWVEGHGACIALTHVEVVG